MASCLPIMAFLSLICRENGMILLADKNRMIQLADICHSSAISFSHRVSCNDEVVHFQL